MNLSGWFLTDDPGTPKKFRIGAVNLIAPLNYLEFGESLFNPTPGQGSSFSLDGGGDEVYLFSGDANTNLTGYSHGFSFGASGEGDSFGRYVISTGEEQFTIQLAGSVGSPNAGPRIGPVVINEIMYHPIPGGDEFVEIKNVSASPVPLFDAAHPTNRWRVNGLGFDFPADVTIGAGERILLTAIDPATFRSRYGIAGNVTIFGPYSGQLQDSGERLELQRPDVPTMNQVPYISVDEVRYNDRAPWPPAADGSGPSLQRLVSAGYGNDPANWTAAIATPGGERPSGTAPAIVTQPQNRVALEGQTLTLSVGATGATPLRYQWRFNGDDLPGATGADLALSNLRLNQAGSYSVVVFNQAGSAVSVPASLTVLRLPRILTAPASQSIRPGVTALFNVNAAGNGSLRYQWFRNGREITDATNATLMIANAKFEDAGDYTVRVTDSVGPIIAGPARLVVLIDPTIVQEPIGQTNFVGASVTLSVQVTNTATLPIGYRWRKGGATVTNRVVYALGDFLTLPNLQSGDAANYSVVCTNEATAAASSPGVLSRNARIGILAAVDADADGMPDDYEQNHGLDKNNAADATADADQDGVSNRDEFVAGTDPQDPNSYLKIENISATGSVIIRFLAVESRTYSLQRRAAADNGSWQVVAGVPAVSASGTQTRLVEVIDPAGPALSPRYYRLVTPGVSGM